MKLRSLTLGLGSVAILGLSALSCSQAPVDTKATQGEKKTKTTTERITRLVEAAADLVGLASMPPTAQSSTLMALYVDYMKEPPKGNETEDAYYARLCTTSFAKECEGVFPEDFRLIALRSLAQNLDAEQTELALNLEGSNTLKDKEKALLAQKPFEQLGKTIKVTKGDPSPWIFVDHIVPLPKRDSDVVIGLVLNEKGEVLLNGKAVGSPLPKATPGSAPSSAALVDALGALRTEWEEGAKQQAEALAAGKPLQGPRAGTPDYYIELVVSPNAPAWYVAWALSACDESGFINPVLIVRAKGSIARKGMLPFPLSKEISKIVKVDVMKDGVFVQPAEKISDKVAARLIPAEGVTVQHLATAIDKLGGCSENPCEYLPNAVLVGKW